LQVATSLPGDLANLQQLARYGSEDDRAGLAAHPETPPELLFFLVADRSAAVRARIAANRATPPQAARILAEDKDPSVREVLAKRIAGLVPNLEQNAASRLGQMVTAALGLLAEDTVVTVRAALAEALATMPDVPRDLVLRLARDTEWPVAEPVIRLSPLLTDPDLISLVVAPPASFSRRAVAGRPGLTESLTDRLARLADDAAILSLLSNGSARLRESTVSALIARARDRPDLQAALVRRPVLSQQAMAALAAIVTDDLVEDLAARADLPPRTATELRVRLTRRSQAGQEELRPGPAEPSVTGQGAEDVFLAAAARADADGCAASLAARGGWNPDALRCLALLLSAKSLISIAWKAGFSPAVAIPVQVVLGGLPSQAVLRPAIPGTWPLTEQDMRNQLRLMAILS
jgi:hypothetical protein